MTALGTSAETTTGSPTGGGTPSRAVRRPRRLPVRAVLSRILGPYLPVLDRIALAIAVFLILFSIVGALWQPYDPYLAAPTEALRPPGGSHLFGTDDLGRDVLSRLLVGAGATLLAALLVIVLTTIIGVAVAAIAAVGPRWLDETLMRVCDIFMALPAIVLALGVAAAMGPSTRSVIVAMVVSSWPGTTRLARSVLRETTGASYVEAARVMGVGRLQLLRRHVLPNSMDAIYVHASMEIAGAIVIMAGLSFLGVGAPPPSANWGAMVAGGKDYVTTAWWVATFPGGAITLAAICFGLLGDSLRMRLDPTARIS